MCKIFNKLNLVRFILIPLLLTTSIILVSCGDKGTSANGPDISDLPSNPSPVFTHYLVNPDSIKGIVPPGSISDNTVAEKSYMFMKNSGTANPDYVGIYAPVDMRLVAIAYRTSQGQNQYLLMFQVSQEVKIRLDHIDFPVEAIRNAGPSSPDPNNDTHTTPPSKTVEFKAGDLIAYSNGTTSGVWDYGVSNSTYENNFVNMARYRNSKQDYEELHSVCPFKYFEPSVKSKYEALFAIQTGQPYSGATCRSASRDVAGTLSGLWYLDKSPYGDFAADLAIASDFDGELRIGGLGGHTMFVSDYPTKPKLPEDVKINDEVCYEDGGGSSFAYFKVLSNTEVKVAYGYNGCPASFPNTNTEIYHR